MKHCFVLFLTATFIGAIANAQLVNNGATITVQSGATIKCTGAIINNSGGIIANAGTVSSDGELRNESGGTLNGAGIYEATTKFINNGVAFSGINLKLIGSSNTDSIKSGVGSTYTNVNLTKGAGNTGTLSDAMTINGILTFDNDNNRLILEDENLTLASGASIASADDNEFIVTNNTGVVTKQALAAAFIYPVGFAAGQFNPVTVDNTGGTSDNFSVRCLQNVLTNGLTGAPVTTDFANNSWVITEGVVGGSNLSLTANWAASDELANFNRVKTGIARYNTGTDWDLPASNVLAASGSGPYLRTRTGITTTGVFAVADLEKVNAARLSLKVYLQGPYNTTTGIMNDGLRSNNLIPVTQPYSVAMGANFTRVGVYDGTPSVNESVPATTVFDVTGTDNDIVDWVYLSLQDGTTPATKLQTRAALIQRDGDIVEYDAVSATYLPVRMPINADGNYHLLIGHRNHLPIRTSVSQLLQDNVTATYTLDLQSKAYQDPAVLALAPPANNPAMKDLGAGKFALWGGNANSNTAVRASGPPALNDYTKLFTTELAGSTGPGIVGVYNTADVNMDGTMRASGPPTLNDYTFLFTTVLAGSTGIGFSQHL